MKLAHLILAHTEPQQLERLLNRLIHPDADIYIHLDKKTEMQPFAHLAKLSNVFFIHNRIKVYWGTYRIVQATLSSFREIAASGKVYHHVNLISGQDYPLQKPELIQTYLKENMGVAFINHLLFDPDWREAQPRIDKYHFNNFRLPGRYIFQRIVNKILPKRSFPNNLIPVGRSQWFTIPLECVSYLIDYWDKNPQIERFMKLTWAPDEFIFHTILYNSPFKQNMASNDLRYIDWSRGGVNPKLLCMDDAEGLLSSGKFYARKFDMNKYPELLDLIDERCLLS